MSFWQDNDLTPKIERLLQRFEADPDALYLGRPWLTSLQLAIEFEQEYPGIARLLGFEVGGAGVREQASLAHYLAHEIMTRIVTGRLPTVEASFLYHGHLMSLPYRYRGNPIESTIEEDHFDLALIRLKEGDA